MSYIKDSEALIKRPDEYDEIIVPDKSIVGDTVRGGALLIGPPKRDPVTPNKIDRTVLLQIKGGYGSGGDKGFKHLWLSPTEARAVAIALLNGAREAEHRDG